VGSRFPGDQTPDTIFARMEFSVALCLMASRLYLTRDMLFWTDLS
jgi:hypothetical protein